MHRLLHIWIVLHKLILRLLIEYLLMKFQVQDFRMRLMQIIMLPLLRHSITMKWAHQLFQDQRFLGFIILIQVLGEHPQHLQYLQVLLPYSELDPDKSFASFTFSQDLQTLDLQWMFLEYLELQGLLVVQQQLAVKFMQLFTDLDSISYHLPSLQTFCLIDWQLHQLAFSKHGLSAV